MSMNESHLPEDRAREQAQQEARYRESVIKEVMTRLSIRAEVHMGSYGSGQKLVISLMDGDTEVSHDYVSLSDLQRQD